MAEEDRDEMLYPPYVVLPPRGSILCVRIPDIRQTDTLRVSWFAGLLVCLSGRSSGVKSLRLG